MELKYNSLCGQRHLRCISKLYLSGIEILFRVVGNIHENTPNCTLVELKFSSGDKIKTSSDAPNCTLVELKWRKDKKKSGYGESPNCTLVELKYEEPAPKKDTQEHSKLYLSGIEIQALLLCSR